MGKRNEFICGTNRALANFEMLSHRQVAALLDDGSETFRLGHLDIH